MRRATPADLDWVMHHRREMFREMGMNDPAGLQAMEATSLPHLAQGLANGSYEGWLVEDQAGRVIAGGGVTQVVFHSSPLDPLPRRPWIVNVYTEPEHRRRGLARRLMDAMVAWCRERGYPSVYLHASHDGRPLYEGMGFVKTNEMRLRLR